MDLNMAKSLLASMMEEKGEDPNEVEEMCVYCEEEVEYKEYTYDQLLSLVKGKGKGKGKDGGKGYGGGKNNPQRFDGNCHHCGVYGHRIANCWKKDQEVENKGKGKG